MRDLLYLAYKRMEENGGRSIQSLKSAIERVCYKWNFEKRTRLALIRRIEAIKELRFYGKSFDVESIVVPGRALIVDLSKGLNEFEKRVYVGLLMKRLFEARKAKRIPPLLIIVEESHLFAPQDEDTYSKIMMRRIAREGRKFGIGLGVVSQRIVGLDKDVISQCGTKFILRIDSKTDLDLLKPYIGLATEEDIRRIPYLPTGVALVTGQATKYPILVSIRPKKSKHYQFL